MSLTSLATVYALRTTPSKASIRSEAPSAPASPMPSTASVPQGAVDALVRWIPTETLTLYAALGALANTMLSTRQSLFLLVMCAVVNVIFVWSLAVHRVVTSVPVGSNFLTEFPKHFPGWEVLLSLAAFICWVSALPESWPTRLAFWDQWYGGAAIVIAALLIPFLAEQLNLSPPGVQTASQ